MILEEAIYDDVKERLKSIQPITEYCPECDYGNTVYWNIKYRHFIYCANCGRKLMLCSECPVRNGEMNCGWSENNPSNRVCNWDYR